jgi:phosphoglycolate phosphatase-like HAD superfamily hydrolase
MRYRCLILDHDDTAVDSTATIHYPAHRRAMELLRPGVEPIDLEGWLLRNFEPGLMPYLTGELGMTERELLEEYAIWQEFNRARRAPFFPGFLDVLRRFRDAGGRIAVVSHSEEELIEGDYRRGDDGDPVVPELVFGWNPEEQRRKPSPWPVREILRTFALEPSSVLVLDDLKPGVLMAQAAGVDVAAAGWGHRIGEIRTYMQAQCEAYFDSIGAFSSFLFDS